MRDIKFDFNANDVMISGGDLDEVNICSLQNATMIFNKAAASILNPALGAWFENIYPNLPIWSWGRVEKTGEKMIKDDGAVVARIKISQNEDGETTTAEIQARYRE